MITDLKLKLISSIRTFLDKWEDKLISKKELKEEREKIKAIINDDKTALILNCYKKLLENNKRILYLTKGPGEERVSFMRRCVAANVEDRQPVILITFSSGLADAVMWSKDMQMNYSLKTVKYSEIDSLREINSIGRIFFFPINEMSFHYAMEQAMTLNKKLLSIGLNPMFIAESFEQFYNRYAEDELEQYLDEYLDEVFYDNIDKEQNIILLADWIYNPESTMSMKRVNKKLINSLDAIIYGPEYLKNAYTMFHEKKAVMDTLDDFENQEVAEALRPVLNQMMLTSSSTVYSGFIISPKNPEIKELNNYDNKS